MKSFFIPLLFLIFSNVLAQESYDPGAEIFIQNNTNDTIYVRFYPVGPLFNGHGHLQNCEYNLKSKDTSTIYRRRDHDPLYPLIYITGLDGYSYNNPYKNPVHTGYFGIPYQTGPASEYKNFLLLNHDGSWCDGNNILDGFFGYGNYVLEIYTYDENANQHDLKSTINIDWLDFNYDIPNSTNSADLYIYIFNISDPEDLDIRHKWDACNNCGPLGWNEPDTVSTFGPNSPLETPGLIQVWKQHKKKINGQWVGYNVPNVTKPPSKGESKSYYQFTDYPLDATNSLDIPSPYTLPSSLHVTPGDFKNAKVNIQHDINFRSGYSTNFSNSILELKENKTLTIPSTSGLSFSGSTSKLITNSGSSINFPAGFQLNFSNGASIDANTTNFTSSGTGNGIKLTNPNSSTINACTFNNAEKPLSIINDNSYHANKKHHITNNTFNLPTGANATCFTGRNLFKINFQNNTLNGHSSNTGDRGIFFSNIISPSTPSGDGEGAGPPESYDLKFVGNTIHNLTLGTMFINSASALAEINFLNNNYTGSKSNLVYGLNAIKTKGIFKNNKFLPNGNYYNFGMIFQMSNPDLHNNLMQSNGATLTLASSHPKMAPYLNANNQNVWNSGSNNLYSVNSDNIKIISPSHPVTDRGKNAFTSDHYHFNGYLSPNQQTTETFQYQSRENCWFPNSSASYNITTPDVAFNYLPVGTFCHDAPVAVDVIINDLGDGVYDTILISIPDSIAELEIDEMYYAQSQDLVNSGNYYNASQNLKWLVNDCMESEFRYSSLYDLYSYYERMDTSSNPGISYGLWNELYDYLLLKIEQYVEDYDFQDIAYNLSIMSQVNMQEYEDAMSKYEGIILEHPDPVQRLLASWDYDALIDLLDTSNYGQGGSMRDFNFENSTMAFAGKNFDDLEPVQKTIHQNYRERRIETERKREDRVNDLLRNEPNAQGNDLAEEMRKEGIKREIESRARMNMMQSRYLSREEKEKRMMEDIDLMVQLMGGNVKGMESPNFTPQIYKLEQNYPNPFNPSTIISFSIPVTSLVKLNVYDITGRLIKVLVNEIKDAGIHNITFDGSRLSSGVYFYKLEAGPSAGSGTNYNQTKRMVMIK
jgi:hypothetical protein